MDFAPSVAHGKHSVRRRCVQATKKQGRNLLSPWRHWAPFVRPLKGGYKNRRLRRVARMLRVWRTHHPGADFFFFFFFWLTRFLIAHATNTKTQMKKNEHSAISGLLFTSSLLAKSGLEVTPLRREAAANRCRARAPSRSTSTQWDREHVPCPAAESLSVVRQSGAASRSCAVRA